MRRTLPVLIIAILTVLSLWAEPARAVECVLPEYVLPKLDTVVDARIAEISAEGRVRLDVATYYKGSGGTSLEAAVTGLGNPGGRMDWSRDPKRGDRVLIGFVRTDEGLRNEICHLLIILRPRDAIPADLQALLGPGQPTGLKLGRGPGSVVWVVVGGLAIAGGLWWYRRRSR